MNHIDPLAISFALHPLHETILEHVYVVLATNDQATMEHALQLMCECGCSECLECVAFVTGDD